MAYIPDQQKNTGLYVPTTNVWDTSRIDLIKDISPEFRELLVSLFQNINNIAITLNAKDSAFYITEEFQTGQVYFNPNASNVLDLRAGFRVVIDTGALGAGATVVAHGLTFPATAKLASLTGGATRSTAFAWYPIGGTPITANVDATNININNTSGVVFDSSMVILEYVQF
jgi:hypothetical protein